MQRLVSVVIPVRNGVKYLREAIESVLANVAPADPFDVEILVVDNGSTDGSPALAESFGKPVRVFSESRRGAAHARNAGVELARGDYLAFLDADDLWLSGKLRRQIEELDARPDLDMVFCFGENFPSPEMTEAQRKDVFCEPGAGPFILPSAMLARREAFLKIGLLPDLHEGEFIAWYSLALSKGARSEVIAEMLVRRRIHLSNSTRVPTYKAGLLRAAKMVLDQKRNVGTPSC